MVRTSKGFTLIEMLVTVMLLSALVLIGSYAYGQFSKLWQIQVNDFDTRLDDARNSILINEVLDSLLPYVVHDVNQDPAIYFEGNRNGFVAVSSKSLVSPNSFSVVRFSVVQNQDLSFRVLYEEWPMVDDVLRSTEQPIDFIGPFILHYSVDDPWFDYFGWRNVEEKSPADDSEPVAPKWLDNFNAIEKKFSPLKTRFRYTIDSKPYQLISSLASAKPALIAGYSGLLRKKNRSEDEETEVWICAIEDC